MVHCLSTPPVTFFFHKLYNPAVNIRKIANSNRLFCAANQLTGFYMMTTLAFNTFMTEVPIMKKPLQSTDLQSKSMGCFLYGRDLRHERVNGLTNNLTNSSDSP